MEIITMFLQYGLIILSAMIIFMLAILMISFFISGKVLGSLDDEFISSIKLTGLLILLGIGIYLIYIGADAWVPGLTPVINNVLIGLYILGALALINMIYDIGYMKSIVFVFISTLINGIIMAIIFFAVASFSAKEGVNLSVPELQLPEYRSIFDENEPVINETEKADNIITDDESIVSETAENVTEPVTDDQVDTAETSEAEKKGPSLPGTTSAEK